MWRKKTDNPSKQANQEKEETGYFFFKPESFDEITDIEVTFETNRNIYINLADNYLNYYEWGKEGNVSYGRYKIDLANFPKLEEYIMSSNVIDKLGENNGNKNKYQNVNYTYFTFVNSEKLEKYEVQCREMSTHPDDLKVSMEKITEDELNDYITKYGKENEMKNLKKILDEDLTREYSIGYGENVN